MIIKLIFFRQFVLNITQFAPGLRYRIDLLGGSTKNGESGVQVVQK